VVKKNSLKTLLAEKGMSQTELANLIDADRINLNKIINNKRGLEHDLAVKIAKVLNINWFQVYENMNMETPIMGEIDVNYQVKLFNMADDAIHLVKVFNYLADKEHIIVLRSKNSHALWLIDKRYKKSEAEFYGYQYGKLKDGSYFVGNNNKNGLYQIGNNHIKGKDTKKLNKTENDFKETNQWLFHSKLVKTKNLDWVMPVCRIDFDWCYVDDEVHQKVHPEYKKGRRIGRTNKPD